MRRSDEQHLAPVFLLTATRLAALATFGAGLSRSGVGACDDGAAYPFTLGVASGSPLPGAGLVRS